jgi:hypothetical protein
VVDTLLPLSLVLALSPVPVITVVLLVLADGVARTGAAFLAGWVGGIAGATVVSGQKPGLLPWVRAIDRFSVRRAGALGLLFSAVSLKNLPVCVAAGGPSRPVACRGSREPGRCSASRCS